MTIESGILHMPRQEVGPGQKHGYIGEETGEVVVYDPPKPGDTNAVPDVDTATSRVNAAKAALAAAERDLERANEGPKADDTDDAEKAAGKSPDKARKKGSNK